MENSFSDLLTKDLFVFSFLKVNDYKTSENYFGRLGIWHWDFTSSDELFMVSTRVSRVYLEHIKTEFLLTCHF